MIGAITSTLYMILDLYKWVVIIAALITWVQPDPNNPVVQILKRLTDPAYKLVKKYIPTTFNGIDLSPIVIIFIIFFLQQLLMNIG